MPRRTSGLSRNGTITGPACSQDSAREVTNELDTIEFLLTKAEIFYLMYRKDTEAQQRAMLRIEDDIARTTEEISGLQRQLESERAILKYKGEYEELAGITSQYKTKAQLQELLSTCAQQKQKVEAEILAVGGKLELKKKQLGLLTSLLLELKQEDESKKSEPALPAEQTAQEQPDIDMEEII